MCGVRMGGMGSHGAGLFALIDEMAGNDCLDDANEDGRVMSGAEAVELFRRREAQIAIVLRVGGEALQEARVDARPCAMKEAILCLDPVQDRRMRQRRFQELVEPLGIE